MNIRKLRKTLMRLKDSFIQDHTYLMDSLVGLFLAGLAAIVLLPLLVSRALVKLISRLLLSRTFGH